MSSACYSCKIVMKLDLTWQICKKYWNIKFHEYLAGGNQAVPCRGGADRQTGMMKPTVAFRNFVNVSKNVSYKLILTFTYICVTDVQPSNGHQMGSAVPHAQWSMDIKLWYISVICMAWCLQIIFKTPLKSSDFLITSILFHTTNNSIPRSFWIHVCKELYVRTIMIAAISKPKAILSHFF